MGKTMKSSVKPCAHYVVMFRKITKMLPSTKKVIENSTENIIMLLHQLVAPPNLEQSYLPINTVSQKGNAAIQVLPDMSRENRW